MNKAELISAIAEESGLSKIDSKKALNALLSAISNELKNGGKVTLVGHGTYQVVDKSARIGINPKTKEPIKIAAKKAVKFKPGADLIY
jgi:DNA-binding protein HU-beta